LASRRRARELGGAPARTRPLDAVEEPVRPAPEATIAPAEDWMASTRDLAERQRRWFAERDRVEALRRARAVPLAPNEPPPTS
jgi:hypothetical protein